MAETINGVCHCGNIRYELRTETALDDIMVRACDCSFCRLHLAQTWSDPVGRAEINIRDAEQLQRYRFATRSTDFLICRTCGAYAGAVICDNGDSWVTLNLRLTGREFPEQPVRYGREDRGTRRARRRLLWTPMDMIEE